MKEEQVITKFKKKAQKILKSDCLNKISYIIRSKNFIFTLFILTLLPGLISCGGKQRSASLVSPPGEATTGDPSPTGNAEANAQTPSPSGGTTPNTPAGTPGGAPQPEQGQENKTRFADVKPIFQQKCAICHGGAGKAQPDTDWQDYATAKSRVDNGELLNRIWTLKDDPARGMPMSNVTNITLEERELIKKWIHDGGLE